MIRQILRSTDSRNGLVQLLAHRKPDRDGETNQIRAALKKTRENIVIILDAYDWFSDSSFFANIDTV